MDNRARVPASAHARFAVPKTSIGSWAFSFGPYEKDPWSFERFLEFAASNGYEGVEINGFRPHPHDEDFSRDQAGALARQIEERGLGISGFAPDLRGAPPGEVDLATYLNRIRSVADFSAAAGIDTVRVDTITPASGPRPLGPREAYSRLVAAFRAAAGLLDDHAIKLVWEFEPGFWINRPSEVRRLLEDVDHPNFGLLFDTSHAHTSAAYGRRQEGSPELLPGGAVDFAKMVSPWVRHLHLIDSDGSLHDEDTSVHMPFGIGEIDFPAVLDALGDSIATLEWWTADYCFWPTTHLDAQTGAAALRVLRDDFLHSRTEGKTS